MSQSMRPGGGKLAGDTPDGPQPDPAMEAAHSGVYWVIERGEILETVWVYFDTKRGCRDPP